MGRVCAASFCRKVMGSKVRCFPFPGPSDEMRLKTWRKRLLPRTISNAFACYRHFSEKQFALNAYGQPMMNLMKRHAVPDTNIAIGTRDPEVPLDAVCRFCLERSEMDYQIISPVWPNPDAPTAEDIADLFGIVITPDDGLPRIVCVTCITKIKYMKRTRQQFQENDRILRAKFSNQAKKDFSRPVKKVSKSINSENGSTSQDTEVTPHVTPPPSSKKHVAPIVEPNNSGSGLFPKITAVASLARNPVEIPSSTSGDDGVRQAAFGSVVYVQEGNTYQQFRIINSQQVMPTSEHEEVVTSAKTGPSDRGSDCVESAEATELLYVEVRDVEPEHEQVKIEYHQFDFGSLHSEDDLKLEEVFSFPKKKLRVDKPFRYDLTKIKDEIDLT